MAKLPPIVAESALIRRLVAAGLRIIHQGKVRVSFQLANGKRLVVATDRVSIFDFVLATLIAGKGELLTAMTVFWVQKVLKDIRNHVVACGAQIDDYLPAALRNIPELQSRGIIVEELEMIPVEYIIRGYLTGSALKSYRTTGEVFGTKLPPGLHDGSELPELMFTPTSKAEEGHDLPLPAADVIAEFGPDPVQTSFEIFRRLAAHARERGIIKVDTKLEYGRTNTGELVLADEFGTPDSSRFWDLLAWQTSQQQQRAPDALDKEFLRKWGKTVETPFGVTGIGNLEPENEGHVAFVHSLTVPPDIIAETAERYRTAYQRLAA